MDRRPIAARGFRWPTRVAMALVKLGITPNQVSGFSVVFAGVGCAAFVLAPTLDDAAPLLWLLGAVMIQLRLVANLLDGLMAVEGGKKSPLGDLYNDVPDRLADTLFLVGAGYGAAVGSTLPAWAVAMGWAAALTAALTAYVRFVGGTLLGHQDFRGPFAKQQRMFFLTVAALAAGGEHWMGMPPRVMGIALAIIALGAAFTAVRRLSAIATALRERAR